MKNLIIRFVESKKCYDVYQSEGGEKRRSHFITCTGVSHGRCNGLDYPRAEFRASRTQISFVIFANFHPNFAKISSKIHLKRLSQVATDRQKFLENRNKFSARQIRARASVVAAHRADIDRLRKSPRRSQRRPPIAAQGYETSSELSQMREDDANFAQALALAEDLFRPSARDRVALRRARESDLG